MTNSAKGIGKFFRNLAILFVVLALLDFLIGKAFHYYYFKQKIGPLYRTTYAIDSTKADVLVFGSSRAIHHYVPEVFENKLKMSFHNCGRDDCNLIYHMALISCILDRYTPKHVIIELNTNELSLSEEGKLSVLTPYKDKPEVYSYLKYNSQYQDIKMLSGTYVYNSMLFHIIAANLGFAPSDHEGFVPLHGKLEYYAPTVNPQTPPKADRVALLDSLLQKLSAKHVPTTLVISPVWSKFNEPDPQVEAIQKLIAKYPGTQFFCYENDPAFLDNKLFDDGRHLNVTGATKFSQDLTDKMLAAK
jgi:hypothetical protein